MIEIYLIYDNMHTNGTINAFICINNHINSCMKCMLSVTRDDDGEQSSFPRSSQRRAA